MAKINNLSDQTFGRLTALHIYEYRGYSVYWLCRCQCGKEAIVRSDNLTTGKVKSCGCFRRDPDVRRDAMLLVDADKRRRIAASGGRTKGARPAGA